MGTTNLAMISGGKRVTVMGLGQFGGDGGTLAGRTRRAVTVTDLIWR